MQYTRVEINLDYTYTIIHFNDAQRSTKRGSVYERKDNKFK